MTVFGNSGAFICGDVFDFSDELFFFRCGVVFSFFVSLLDGFGFSMFLSLVPLMGLIEGTRIVLRLLQEHRPNVRNTNAREIISIFILRMISFCSAKAFNGCVVKVFVFVV